MKGFTKRLAASIVAIMLLLQMTPVLSAFAVDEVSTDVYKTGEWDASNGSFITIGDVNIGSSWEPDPYYPRITEVYSVNAALGNCYYVPAKSQIPNLQQLIEKEGEFVVAYMGYYDMKGSSLNPNEAYKPAGVQSRALEVLGYDYLLARETYKNDKYIAEPASGSVMFETALMNIYKSLGIERYEVDIAFSSNHSLTLDNNPMVIGLPSYVSGLNTDDARTDVFVTRSNPFLYIDQAERDLNISSSSDTRRTITASEFFQLLVRMLKFYGEPVISQQEEYILLQAYGKDIPLHLTQQEKEAFSYLKCRGILESDIEWSSMMTQEDMLDTLMRVKDKESRTNYKEVQIVQTIGDELVSAGYYPTEVEFDIGPDASEYEASYDYTAATSYDYYVAMDDKAAFKTSVGSLIQNPYIPSDPQTVSPAYMDSFFNGIVDGKYYHFKIPIDYPYDTVVVNTGNDEDRPRFWELPPGGGIYVEPTYDSSRESYSFKRRPFQEQEYQSSTDQERKGNVLATRRANFTDVLATSLSAMVSPFTTTAYAASGSGSAETVIPFTNATAEILNLDYLKNLSPPTETRGYIRIKYDVPTDTLTIRSNYLTETEIRAMVVKKTKESFRVIASLTSDETGVSPLMIRYNDFIGDDYDDLFINTGDIPQEVNGVLTLYSEFGAVKLNNSTHEVVVGSVVYRVPDRTMLYTYIPNTLGTTELWVDFRAAFGWSTYSYNLEFTKSPKGEQVNLKKITDIRKSTVSSYPVNTAGVNSTLTARGVVATKEKNGSTVDKYLMTSRHPLSNWFIYTDGSTGKAEDWLFVFYLEDMLKAYGVTPPTDGLQKMTEVMGYSVDVDGWVVRAYKLVPNESDEVGKISYNPKYGYLYNMPPLDDGEEFDVLKYMEGEYMLPLLFYGKDSLARIRTVNVNYRPDLEPGDVATSTTTKINIGKLVGIRDRSGATAKNASESYTPNTSPDITPAPVGIDAYLGNGGKGSVSTINQLVVDNSTKQGNVYFYGHEQITVGKKSDSSRTFTLDDTGLTLTLPGDTKAWRSMIVRDDCEVFVIQTGNANVSQNPDRKEPATSELGDGDSDKYQDFEEFTVRHLLNAIDNSSSVAVYIALTLLPQIGIMLVTILMGLSLISDIKIVQMLCDKFVDPVKLLSFGRLNIHELEFKRMFLSLMLAYLGLALVLDGNLLRILEWVLEIYNDIVQIIKLT